MTAPPPRTPADWLASILLSLSLMLDGFSMYSRFPRPLALLIVARIRANSQRFRRIAGQVAAGTYVQRRTPARRRHTGQKPRRRNPLPHGFGWLTDLVPQTATYGWQLEFLLADPEVAALMAAAPAPLRRPLRSLCRMLGVPPPPILALRKSPSPAPAERERPATQLPERERAAAPERQAPPPRPTSPPPPAISQAHGPPLPA